MAIAPVPAVVAYVVPTTCSLFDPAIVAGPALALLLGTAGTGIGIAGLRSRASASTISLVVIGALECSALALGLLQLALCIPAAP